MNSPLKVAFLVDDYSVDYTTFELIEFVSNNDSFLNPVIFTGYKDKNLISKKSIKKKIFDWLVRKVRKKETKIVRKQFPNYLKTKSINNIKNLEIIKLNGIWSKSCLYLDFDKENIEKISKQNIDLIIRCGTGIVIGDILSIPRFGILSIHNGDNRVNRGGPPGFWEAFNDEPTIGFVIQKLNSELDGGDVILRGNIMSTNYWLMNDAIITKKSIYFFKNILLKIFEFNRLPEFEKPSLHHNKLYKFDDDILIIIRYINKTLIKDLFAKIKEKIFGRKIIEWSIAYSKFDNFKKSLWRYKEIKNPEKSYLADPFVVTFNNRSVIFAEDYSYDDFKGRISAIEIKNNNTYHLGVVIKENFHMSFPYTFEYKNKLYMVPETHQINEIRLYECTNFPLKWSFKMTLMKNISSADTLIFKHNKFWFMLTNKCSSNLRDFNSELHIFYSDNLFSNDWKPISSGNPVIFDSRRARNGGIFFHDKNIYRINQIHDKNHYGRKFGINLISKLDENSFEEKRIDHVEANFKDDIVSTHHFNTNSNYSVVDFMRKYKK